MKIAVLSPSLKHLQAISRILEVEGHDVVSYAGGKSHLCAAALREHPDILIADGLCGDAEELAQARFVTLHYPRTAVLLMRAAHTSAYLVAAERAGVREVLPSPVSADALLSAVRRIAGAPGSRPGVRQGNVVAVLPCKGGCGATFLATNLAWELGRRHSALLVDMNLQFGDAASFVQGGCPARTWTNVIADIGRLDAALLAASTVRISRGFSMLAAPSDPGTALDVQPHDVQVILDVATRSYDYVLLDVPRTLGPTNIRALDRAARILPVLQPTVPAIHDAARLRHVFLSLGYAPEKMHFIVNGCGTSPEIGLAQIQRSLGGGALSTLAHDASAVTSSVNRGEPLVQCAPLHPISLQIATLARDFDLRPHQGIPPGRMSPTS